MRFLVPKLAIRNLRSDWFSTWCAIIGVALGTATVNVVLTLDTNTRSAESRRWSTNPDLPVDLSATVGLVGYRKDGTTSASADAKEETHEDYQVMRSAIRLGSLSAFLVGALIVFFTFRVVVEQRRREIALVRSLGASRGQVAGVFLLEALIVGVLGAGLGLVMAPPLSIIAALGGITTTGRSELRWLYFPWRQMLVVSGIGALTAILGILRPLYDVLRLDVATALQPRFEAGDGPSQRSGITVLALPFMALLYVLIRPFFVEVLPSLAFFVLEAGLVCAGFLSLLVIVPEVVSRIGTVVARILPEGPRAARLLTVRRIERAGHEFSWAVSGVMLVFALLLGLHVVTHALKLEVMAWATGAVKEHAFLYTRSGRYEVPTLARSKLDQAILQVPYSGRTPWPNAVMAVDPVQFRALLRAHGEETTKVADEFGKGKVILSSLMAKRHGLVADEILEIRTSTGARRFQVVAVSDVGFVPNIGPYRDSKTYALISAEDFGLIDPYAGPMGSGLLLYDRSPDRGVARWSDLLSPARGILGLRAEIGERFTADRVKETDRDFVIFDVILFLTGVLAAVGIANNLVLSAHVRRREIGLYRVLGMQAGQIRNLFLVEGAFIGVLGGVMAVVLGIPLGFLAIGALEVISAFEVHFDFPVSYAVWTLVGATVVSVVSAIHPASRAAKVESREAVHWE